MALFRRLNGEFVFNWFINLTVSVEFFHAVRNQSICQAAEISLPALLGS
ncbi:hypothetical protein [Variovorax sp. RA8]|nr:hypothetical protein [Variovorax sp. RA8]